MRITNFMSGLQLTMLTAQIKDKGRLGLNVGIPNN